MVPSPRTPETSEFSIVVAGAPRSSSAHASDGSQLCNQRRLLLRPSSVLALLFVEVDDLDVFDVDGVLAVARDIGDFAALLPLEVERGLGAGVLPLELLRPCPPVDFPEL